MRIDWDHEDINRSQIGLSLALLLGKYSVIIVFISTYYLIVLMHFQDQIRGHNKIIGQLF